MSTSRIILLLLAVACWLGMLMMFPAFVGVDAVGDASVGVAYGYLMAWVFAGFTWLWIGGLLLSAGSAGLLPGRADLAALLLVPACAAAVGAALYLLSEPHTRWPAVVPIAAPLLFTGYVFALTRPSWRPTLSRPVPALTVCLLALVLAVLPWPSVGARVRGKALQRAQHARDRAAWEAAERERAHAENLKKLRAMQPGTSITEWYTLLQPDSGVQAEALEALRHDPSRQAQIEEMLGYGVQRGMTLLPDLDLHPTPELCQAAGAFFLKTATSSHLRKRDDPVPYTDQVSFHELLPGIRWLVAHGCNCDEGIAALDASAKTYLDSPERQKVLADLDALRQHK